MTNSWEGPPRPLSASADHGRILLSTSTSQPRQSSSPNVPAKIKALIAELGLRYRPTATADLVAHGALLALLARDLADLPPDRVERAINAWVRAERWMPKAADLVALCQQQQRAEFKHIAANDRSPRSSAQAFADSRNAAMATEPTARKDIEWYVDDADEPKLRYQREAPIMPDRVALRDVDRLNRALRKYGAGFRWDASGYAYDLVKGQPDLTDPDGA